MLFHCPMFTDGYRCEKHGEIPGSLYLELHKLPRVDALIRLRSWQADIEIRTAGAQARLRVQALLNAVVPPNQRTTFADAMEGRC